MADGTVEKKSLKCGLIMPISPIEDCSAAHWEEVAKIIREALSDTEFSVDIVSDSNEVGIIQKRIVQNIYDNDIVICDVSAKNPNVMFELGMRLAFDKPTIIIKDEVTKYSFDTAPIEHIEYPRSLHYPSIKAFKDKLREKVIATFEASKRPEYTTFLKHFGKFVVAKIDEKTVGKDDFILQALNDLRVEMRSLARDRSDSGQRGLSSSAAGLKGGGISEQDFVQLYVDSGIAKIDKLLDVDSNEFEDFFQAYCKKFVPDHIWEKPRHAASIKSGLVKMLNETIPF